MNRRIYIISDTHFGHANILKFTNRDGKPVRGGFSSVEEMDECLVDNWNSVVRAEDIIYHLGDVYFGDGNILKKLNGRKRLILGNHDNGKSRHLQSSFQKISLWRMFPEFGTCLTHTPIIIPKMAKYDLNIHGHIHGNESPTENHLNVSVEAINYTPVDLEKFVHEYRTKIGRPAWRVEYDGFEDHSVWSASGLKVAKNIPFASCAENMVRQLSTGELNARQIGYYSPERV